jgi:hypothetical protein
VLLRNIDLKAKEEIVLSWNINLAWLFNFIHQVPTYYMAKRDDVDPFQKKDDVDRWSGGTTECLEKQS